MKLTLKDILKPGKQFDPTKFGKTDEDYIKLAKQTRERQEKILKLTQRHEPKNPCHVR